MAKMLVVVEGLVRCGRGEASGREAFNIVAGERGSEQSAEVEDWRRAALLGGRLPGEGEEQGRLPADKVGARCGGPEERAGWAGEARRKLRKFVAEVGVWKQERLTGGGDNWAAMSRAKPLPCQSSANRKISAIHPATSGFIVYPKWISLPEISVFRSLVWSLDFRRSKSTPMSLDWSIV